MSDKCPNPECMGSCPMCSDDYCWRKPSLMTPPMVGYWAFPDGYDVEPEGLPTPFYAPQRTPPAQLPPTKPPTPWKSPAPSESDPFAPKNFPTPPSAIRAGLGQYELEDDVFGADTGYRQSERRYRQSRLSTLYSPGNTPLSDSVFDSSSSPLSPSPFGNNASSRCLAGRRSGNSAFFGDNFQAQGWQQSSAPSTAGAMYSGLGSATSGSYYMDSARPRPK